MVRTCSTHPLHHPVQPPPDIPGGSNDPGLAEFLKQMTESIEVLRRQNEELSAQFTTAEAQKEKESAERHGKERRDEVRAASGLLTLILRTTKARSKGGVREDVRGKFLDLTEKMSQTVDRKEESAKKSQLAESLVGKIEMRRGLIDRGIVGESLGMVSRGIAAQRRR